MKANPVGWFEIPVTDMGRAQAFYENVFDCKLELHDIGGAQMAWFPSDEHTNGAPGTLIKGEWYKPSKSGTLVYLTAPDIDAHLKRIEANGGKVLVPKNQIGEHGYVAHFEDSEGNMIALHAREG